MQQRGKRRFFSAQGVVEFALVGPLFFLMLFGTIEAGRLLWINHELTDGTRAGARWASVRGERFENAGNSQITAGQVEAVILDSTSVLNNSLTVNLSWDPDRAPGSQVTVATTYVYQPLIGNFVGIGSFTMSRQSELTIHY